MKNPIVFVNGYFAQTITWGIIISHRKRNGNGVILKLVYLLRMILRTLMISKSRQRHDSMAGTGENVILTEWQSISHASLNFCWACVLFLLCENGAPCVQWTAEKRRTRNNAVKEYFHWCIRKEKCILLEAYHTRVFELPSTVSDRIVRVSCSPNASLVLYRTSNRDAVRMWWRIINFFLKLFSWETRASARPASCADLPRYIRC